jgi:ribosomal protein L34E
MQDRPKFTVEVYEQMLAISAACGLCHRNLKSISRIKPRKVKKSEERVPKVWAPQNYTDIEHCGMENLGAKIFYMYEWYEVGRSYLVLLVHM